MEKKFSHGKNPLKQLIFLWVAITFLGVLGPEKLSAEGSKDFLSYPGYRLFFWAESPQQLKVYAEEGEFINLGASHVGITGGFIRVFRPDGSLAVVYDNTGPTAGQAIINNDVEELAGPTGGGTTMGAGYVPGVIEVMPGESGIWTVTLEYPSYTGTPFNNLLNGQPWTRDANQPTNRRVVLAWDITITDGNAGNMGGTPVEGRVFSNEYNSIVSRNGITTSPVFYVLTRDGFQYEIEFHETDPWGFPIFSNNVGIVNGNAEPQYVSLNTSDYTRSNDPSSWVPGEYYLYEPQANDYNSIINNKVFFNFPDPFMPAVAMTTDVFRNETYSTWLFKTPSSISVQFGGFSIASYDPSDTPCQPNTFEAGFGGFFKFETDQSGNAELRLDLNNNGNFDDPVDRILYKYVEEGTDSIFWDGKNGVGQNLPVGFGIVINYQLSLHAGEVHIMMSDVENNMGGVTISLLNDLSVGDTEIFYYNHEPIGGPKSGNTTGEPLPTTDPFIYGNNFGDEKLLDYWTFVGFSGTIAGSIVINVVTDCDSPQVPDSDDDGIADDVDLDDDNDGVPDAMEFCNPSGGFGCLPGMLDPSGDEDADGRANYLDADDPAVGNMCQDADGDGICDKINSVYDTDSDGVPDHLDLDSDNDGITDLVEAGHDQPDIDGDGVIDGTPAEFGMNGFYNPIASDPDAPDAIATYVRLDTDGDLVPDHDDLDSDNDGIHDVTEAGYSSSDSDNDGRIDDGMGNPPRVNKDGLAPLIDPAVTGNPIPYPPDWDGDGVPDWHDLDSDNDGINDVTETNQPDPDGDGIIGEGNPIIDADGKATGDPAGNTIFTTSNPTDTDGDLTPDFHDLDSDNDGITDVHEAEQPDDDNDGIIGTGTPVVNSNGQPSADGNGDPISSISNPRDLDNDGAPDFQDIDRDGDGIDDAYECSDGWPCQDTDDDGIPDVDDGDSDDDGMSDSEECPGGIPCPDSNTNGIDNFREYDCGMATIPVITGLSANNVFCEGETVELTATNSVLATDSLTYTWTGPGGFFFSGRTGSAGPFTLQVPNVNLQGGGLYTLRLTSDLGCNSAPADVFVQVKPKPEPPVIDLSRNELCEGEDLQLSSSLYNGNPVEYEWFFDDGTGMVLLNVTDEPVLLLENISGNEAGQYSVNVTVEGCRAGRSNSETVEVNAAPVVNEPSNSTAAGNPACEGENVQLNSDWIADATYQWYGPGGFTSNLYNPLLQNVNASHSGDYFVVITRRGCSVVTSPTQVYVSDKPQRPVLSPEVALCEGTDGELNILVPADPGNNASFHWYRTTGQFITTTNQPALAFPDVSNSEAGEYYVVIEEDGCESDPSAPALLNIDRLPLERAFIPEDILYTCAEEEVWIEAVLPAQAHGLWTSPGNAGIVQPEMASTFVWNLSSGSNTFIWHLSHGACIDYDSDTLLIIHEPGEVIANDDSYTLSFNESLASALFLMNDDVSNVNNWELSIVNEPVHGTLVENEDGTFSYQQQPNFFGTDQFVYRLCNVNCPGQCDEAVVTIRTEGVGENGNCFIPNFITPNGDGANDAFIIPCLAEQYTDNEVAIFNRWGDKVFDAAPYNNTWDGTYRNSPLPPGTYFYVVKFSPELEAEQGYLTIIR